MAANILRTSAGRLMGLNAANDLVFRGTKIYFGDDDTGLAQDVLDLSGVIPNLMPSGDTSGLTDLANIQALFNADRNVILGIGEYYVSASVANIAHQFLMIGAGVSNTIINIIGSIYFLDTPRPFDGIEISGITFSGGLGAIRSTFTGNLDSNRKFIVNNSFIGYTQCAINTNHNDCPEWDITTNTFAAASSVGTIGIALGRNSDVSNIHSNNFGPNAVHIKLNASGNVFIGPSNDFGNTAGTGRIAIWITGNNTNYTYITYNKFGNENLAPSDYRVAIVPALSGTWNGDELPDFSTLSQAGAFTTIIENNYINGAAGNGPVLYDVSGSLLGSSISYNTLNGTLPSAMHQNGQSPFVDNYTEGNIKVLDNFTPGGASSLTGIVSVSNLGNYGHVADPRFTLEGDSRFPNQALVANNARVGYVQNLSTLINSFSLGGPTKVGSVTDATGGTDAAEFNITAAAQQIYAAWANAPTPGTVFWLEFDLIQPVSSPAAQIGITIIPGSAGTPFYWSRLLNVPTIWQTFRFPITICGSQTSRLAFSTVSTGNVNIGRVRVYQSRSPINFGLQTFDSIALASGLSNYANDAAAATGGVLVNQMYRNGSIVMIRVS